jgi:hypothetical protein
VSKLNQTLERRKEINKLRKLELLDSKFNNIKKWKNQKKRFTIIPKGLGNRNLDEKDPEIDKIKDSDSNETYYISNTISVDVNPNIEKIDDALTNISDPKKLN